MPRSPKITIVSAWVGDEPAWLGKIVDNHKEYAAYHGYEYLLFDNVRVPGFRHLANPNPDPRWIMLEALQSSLGSSDFVFWIDADSAFVEIRRNLSDVLPTGSKSLTFTGDPNDLCNTGHLLVRNTAFSRGFLNDWGMLAQLPFPKLSTTMQTEDGYVGDQVALNYLLGGGKPDAMHILKFGPEIFNTVNGWRGNPHRRHRNFHKTHAPTSFLRVQRAKRLVAPSLRKHVKIVPQHRLNAYPWWKPGEKGTNRRGPIVHFVGPWKNLIDDFADGREVR